MKLLLLLLILLHPLILLQGYMSGNWYSILHDYSLGIVFGVFSYGYMVISLMLATRIRFFDRLFGQDKVIKIHSHLATVAIFLGFVHHQLKESYFSELSLQISMGQAAMYLALLIATVTVVFMVGRFRFPLPGLQAVHQWGRKFSLLDYDKLKLFHNLFSLVLVFLIIHVYLSSSTQESTLRIVTMGGWGALGIFRYSYFMIKRKWMNRRYTVASVNQVTPTTFELQLESSGRLMSYEPGQFCYIKVHEPELKGKEHPFTLSSSPQDKLLSFTIKQLGDYTKNLAQISTGATVSVDGPYGKFTPQCNKNAYLFIAAGIGITPFLSILKSWKKEQLRKPVTLIWSVSHESELVDVDFLKELEQVPNFDLIIFVTRNPETTYQKGRVTSGDTLSHYVDREVYLCGPLPFMKSVRNELKRIGAKGKGIHSESFSG